MELEVIHSNIQNSGLAFCNFDKATPEKTLVVLGLPRGGTSMVARTLAWLDIPMGVPKEPTIANYEDPEFVSILHTTAQGCVPRVRFRNLVKQRNDRYAVWGFKVPMALVSLKLLEADLRNPHFVFIFRDPFAAALRNTVSTNADVLVALRFYSILYATLWDWLGHTRAPCMLASYEKAIFDPKLFVASLAKFAGVSSDKVSIATDQIQANHPDYVGVS